MKQYETEAHAMKSITQNNRQMKSINDKSCVPQMPEKGPVFRRCRFSC